MFDAKSILEAIVKGAGAPAQQSGAQSRGGRFGDILGQLAQMVQQGAASAAVPGTPGGAMGGLGDILGKLQQVASDAAASVSAPGSAGGPAAGGLGDILGKLQQAAAGAASGGPGGLGGLGDILGQVLGQATQGAREGAGKIGDATGLGDAITKALGGKSPADILEQLQQIAAQNQFGAGAAAGGLGSILLGTKAGRAITADVAKLGALALIGGLAYKAYQNYQAGKPPIAGVHTLTEQAPAGSGFEPDAVTPEAAELYIKAMIAAAAADGRVDQGEVGKIIAAEKQAGLGENSESFLKEEMQNPATADDLADAVQSPEQAIQVYTAARLAVTPDGGAEDAFLAKLADKLGIDAKLVAQIDAAAHNAA